MTDKAQEVEMLIAKAARAANSGDALRYSQAACNAANAICAIKTSGTIK
jgi:hypothetical protein